MYRGQEHIEHILRSALFGDYRARQQALAQQVREWESRRLVRRFRTNASALCVLWVLPALGISAWSFSTGGKYWGLALISIPVSWLAGGLLMPRDPDPTPELADYRQKLNSVCWLVRRLCEDRVEVSEQDGHIVFRGVHSRARLQGRVVITYMDESERVALTAAQINVVREMIPEHTNDDSRAVLERHLGR